MVNNYHILGFPGVSMVKNLPGNAKDAGSIPGLGRSPGGGHGNLLNILVGKVPWTEEPSRLLFIGSGMTERLNMHYILG